jgi:hypothetical protein
MYVCMCVCVCVYVFYHMVTILYNGSLEFVHSVWIFLSFDQYLSNPQLLVITIQFSALCDSVLKSKVWTFACILTSWCELASVHLLLSGFELLTCFPTSAVYQPVSVCVLLVQSVLTLVCLPAPAPVFLPHPVRVSVWYPHMPSITVGSPSTRVTD